MNLEKVHVDTREKENQCPSSVHMHTQKRIFVQKKALENIKVAQGRQKKYYDAKHNQDKGKYKVGVLVLVKNCN